MLWARHFMHQLLSSLAGPPLSVSRRKNITVVSIAEWARHPLGKPGLCMVGEAFNILNSGWAQGPWHSAVACVEANFMDVITPEAQKNMEFIE